MPSKQKQIQKDIVRLHEALGKVTSLAAARNLGIKIRRVETPSPNKPIPFSKCLFLPPSSPKGEKTSEKCAKPALEAPSSLPSSLPTASTPHTSSRFSSACSSSRPWSYSSSPLSSTCDGLDNGGYGPAYPMINYVAKSNGHDLPDLPKLSRPSVLKPDGATTKGKWHAQPALELSESGQWKITQVLEDTTYNHPHAIAEILVDSQSRTDGSYLTASEIRAIIQVMRVRMAMPQYQDHPSLPVLALSYIGVRSENEMECKSGRILQAHHNGRQLVIQYSHRFDFVNADAGPASLDTFLRYYFSEPVITSSFGGKKERDSWNLLQRWKVLRERRGVEMGENSRGRIWGWFSKIFAL
ncbi:hypothetical protein BDW59DRAFT_161011 [Aspergillus cavernicola]|uniref:Uncharacterized protein n=1 Tax=Aspergillus cavernicola TaxID=176166 RepID=A0ABR4IFF1_9EURO